MNNNNMQEELSKNPELAREVSLLSNRAKNKLGIDTPMTEEETKEADGLHKQMMDEAEDMLKEYEI